MRGSLWVGSRTAPGPVLLQSGDIPADAAQPEESQMIRGLGRDETGKGNPAVVSLEATLLNFGLHEQEAQIKV